MKNYEKIEKLLNSRKKKSTVKASSWALVLQPFSSKLSLHPWLA
jgi:hypothetical protein